MGEEKKPSRVEIVEPEEAGKDPVLIVMSDPKPKEEKKADE